MKDSHLRQIYTLGQEMVSVLQNGDVDRYFELLEERGTLVEELNGYDRPSENDPDRSALEAALKEQHQVLLQAVADQERRMQEALAGMQRYRGAARSYQRPDERSQILNENLRV